MTKLEKYLVWGSSAVVTATGLAYAWMKYLIQPADPFAVVNHPLQPLVLKLHIVTAPVFVFAIGMIAMRHIWPHFRKGLARARRSGVSSMLLVLPLIVSGYALQAISAVSWLSIVGYVHLALGIAFALAALGHAIATRAAPRAMEVNSNEQANAAQVFCRMK